MQNLPEDPNKTAMRAKLYNDFARKYSGLSDDEILKLVDQEIAKTPISPLPALSPLPAPALPNLPSDQLASVKPNLSHVEEKADRFNQLARAYPNWTDDQITSHMTDEMFGTKAPLQITQPVGNEPAFSSIHDPIQINPESGFLARQAQTLAEATRKGFENVSGSIDNPFLKSTIEGLGQIDTGALHGIGNYLDDLNEHPIKNTVGIVPQMVESLLGSFNNGITGIEALAKGEQDPMKQYQHYKNIAGAGVDALMLLLPQAEIGKTFGSVLVPNNPTTEQIYKTIGLADKFIKAEEVTSDALSAFKGVKTLGKNFPAPGIVFNQALIGTIVGSEFAALSSFVRSDNPREFGAGLVQGVLANAPFGAIMGAYHGMQAVPQVLGHLASTDAAIEINRMIQFGKTIDHIKATYEPLAKNPNVILAPIIPELTKAVDARLKSNITADPLSIRSIFDMVDPASGIIKPISSVDEFLQLPIKVGDQFANSSSIGQTPISVGPDEILWRIATPEMFATNTGYLSPWFVKAKSGEILVHPLSSFASTNKNYRASSDPFIILADVPIAKIQNLLSFNIDQIKINNASKINLDGFLLNAGQANEKNLTSVMANPSLRNGTSLQLTLFRGGRGSHSPMTGVFHALTLSHARQYHQIAGRVDALNVQFDNVLTVPGQSGRQGLLELMQKHIQGNLEAGETKIPFTDKHVKTLSGLLQLAKEGRHLLSTSEHIVQNRNTGYLDYEIGGVKLSDVRDSAITSLKDLGSKVAVMQDALKTHKFETPELKIQVVKYLDALADYAQTGVPKLALHDLPDTIQESISKAKQFFPFSPGEKDRLINTFNKRFPDPKLNPTNINSLPDAQRLFTNYEFGYRHIDRYVNTVMNELGFDGIIYHRGYFARTEVALTTKPNSSVLAEKLWQQSLPGDKIVTVASSDSKGLKAYKVTLDPVLNSDVKLLADETYHKIVHRAIETYGNYFNDIVELPITEMALETYGINSISADKFRAMTLEEKLNHLALTPDKQGALTGMDNKFRFNSEDAKVNIDGLRIGQLFKSMTPKDILELYFKMHPEKLERVINTETFSHFQSMFDGLIKDMSTDKLMSDKGISGLNLLGELTSHYLEVKPNGDYYVRSVDDPNGKTFKDLVSVNEYLSSIVEPTQVTQELSGLTDIPVPPTPIKPPMTAGPIDNPGPARNWKRWADFLGVLAPQSVLAHWVNRVGLADSWDRIYGLGLSVKYRDLVQKSMSAHQKAKKYIVVLRDEIIPLLKQLPKAEYTKHLADINTLLETATVKELVEGLVSDRFGNPESTKALQDIGAQNEAVTQYVKDKFGLDVDPNKIQVTLSELQLADKIQPHDLGELYRNLDTYATLMENRLHAVDKVKLKIDSGHLIGNPEDLLYNAAKPFNDKWAETASGLPPEMVKDIELLHHTAKQNYMETSLYSVQALAHAMQQEASGAIVGREAFGKTMNPIAKKIGDKLIEQYAKAGIELGIADHRRFKYYATHTFERRSTTFFEQANLPQKEFFADMVRAGYLYGTAQDGIANFVKYIDTGFKAREGLYESAQAIRDNFDKSLEKIVAFNDPNGVGSRRLRASYAFEFENFIREMEGRGGGHTRTEFAQHISEALNALNVKLTPKAGLELFDNLMTATNAALLAGSPAQGIRDFFSVHGMMHVRFGTNQDFAKHFSLLLNDHVTTLAKRGLNLTERASLLEKMLEDGRIPTMQIEGRTAPMEDMTNSLSAYISSTSQWMQAIHNVGLKASLQEQMFELIHGAIYLERTSKAMEAFKREGATAETISQDLALHTYNEGVRNKFFQELQQVDGQRKASDYLARQTGFEHGVYYGYNLMPEKTRSVFGRILSQLGTWSAAERGLMVSTLTTARNAKELGSVMGRIAKIQGGYYLLEKLTGISMGRWAPLSSMAPSFGPLASSLMRRTNPKNEDEFSDITIDMLRNIQVINHVMKAYDMHQKRFGLDRTFMQIFGFNADLSRNSWIDHMMGANPLLSPNRSAIGNLGRMTDNAMNGNW